MTESLLSAFLSQDAVREKLPLLHLGSRVPANLPWLPAVPNALSMATVGPKLAAIAAELLRRPRVPVETVDRVSPIRLCRFRTWPSYRNTVCFLLVLRTIIGHAPCQGLTERVHVSCERVYRRVELLPILQSAQGALVDLGTLGNVGQGEP